jgi:peptidoglycan/xylan/chitin deacetylase (PgdA/CDA1 family)
VPSQRKILILSIARPRRKTGEPRPAAPSTDFCPRPRFVRFLTLLLRLLGYKLATVSEALRAPFGRFVCLTFDGASSDIHDRLFPQLKALRVPATVFVPTKAIHRSVTPVDADTKTRPDHLTWEQLRELEQHGWEIGSLGHEPVDLTERSYLEQRRQIARSRFLLASRLSREPRLFAYPFGAYDATTVSCIREQGFDAALTMRKGVNYGPAEAFHLKRLALSSSSVRDLLLVLRHALAEGPAGAQADEIRAGAAASTSIARSGAAP